MNWEHLFELRAQAQSADLRNRQEQGLTPRCRCGNMLTISDRNVCRECRRSR